jgi:methyl-accepting chemotaxis protein
MFIEPEYRDSAAYRGFWEALRRGDYQAAEYKRIAKEARPSDSGVLQSDPRR